MKYVRKWPVLTPFSQRIRYYSISTKSYRHPKSCNRNLPIELKGQDYRHFLHKKLALNADAYLEKKEGSSTRITDIKPLTYLPLTLSKYNVQIWERDGGDASPTLTGRRTPQPFTISYAYRSKFCRMHQFWQH